MRHTLERSCRPKTEPMRWDSGWLPKSDDTYATRSRSPRAKGRAAGCDSCGGRMRLAVTAQNCAYFWEMASASSALKGYAIAWKGCTGGSRPICRSLRTCAKVSNVNQQITRTQL